MKAEIPATIPASIVSARAGLAAISAKILSPAGTDLYNELVNDVPMINNSGIATMSPTDHLPNIVLGIILQGCFVILSSFHGRKRYIRLILHSCNLVCPVFPCKKHFNHWPSNKWIELLVSFSVFNGVISNQQTIPVAIAGINATADKTIKGSERR
jgi:hypothetical protein